MRHQLRMHLNPRTRHNLSFGAGAAMLSRILYYRPRLEAALSAIDKNRLRLPIVNAPTLFDDFNDKPVVLRELAFGPYSSPVVDMVMLAKIAACLSPLRVLEVGSYRGHTAKLLAEHTPSSARITAFDRDPRHGAAYQNSPVAVKIERRVGEVSRLAFASDKEASFDLIYLDADHFYGPVKRDTEILLPKLAPNGMFIWHDYANWGQFSKTNGVPEYLHELAETRPVVAVGGTWLAAHSPAWTSGAPAEQLAKALRASLPNAPGIDPWTVDNLRG